MVSGYRPQPAKANGLVNLARLDSQAAPEWPRFPAVVEAYLAYGRGRLCRCSVKSTSLPSLPRRVAVRITHRKLASILDTTGLQAVVVETEVRDLVPTAARCIQAGLHVHLDKPAGESFGAYKRLLDESCRRKLTVQMGYVYRYHPAFRFCVRAVRDGWLGEVFEIDGVISKMVGPESRKRLAEYQGGAMFELGCHLIDVLVWILGKPDRITPFVRRTRSEEDRLADNQLAVFEYPEVTATIRSALVEVDGQRRRQFVVCGDQGTFDLCPLSGASFRLALDRPCGSYRKGYQEVALPEEPRRYVGDFLDLAAVIRGEKESEFSPEHDLAVHEAVLLASGYDTR